MVELNELQGLWRRTLIAWPGDRFDTTTEVYWLQGPSRYADLRIPAGRPKLEAAACLRDLDWPMLRFMTLQEGFIGHLELSHSPAHWHGIFDYQPASGVADKGRLEFADDILVEHGVEASYVEHWRREAGTAQDVVALWLAADGSSAVGFLIAATDAFMYARGRAEPLPPNTKLSSLLDAAGSLGEAQALFDCEISFGRKGAEEWRIERSSLPFREGKRFRSEIDDDFDRLEIEDLTSDGIATKRSWRIVAWEGTPRTARSIRSV